MNFGHCFPGRDGIERLCAGYILFITMLGKSSLDWLGF